MKTVEISYNPYKMETHMFIDNIDVCRNDIYEKFKEFIQNKIPLQTWIEPIHYLDWAGLANEISDPERNDEVAVYFSGRKIDFEDLQRSLEEQNNKRSERSRVIYYFEHKKILDDKVLSQNIEEVVKQIKTDRFRQLLRDRTTDSLKIKYNDLDKNYAIAKESEFYIVFAGVYSSGKSTILNTLIRHDILPTSSRTCTAKNCRIRHDSSLGSKVSLCCYDEQNNVVVEKRIYENDAECAAAFIEISPMKEKETKEKYSNVYMMEIGVDLTHLYPKSVSEDKFTIVLLDTPGVDSAQSSEDGHNKHAELALEAISMDNKPMIILCADANKYEDKSIGEFMRKILAETKQNGSGFNDRFLFLMNKCDACTYKGTESAGDVKTSFAEYLTNPTKWDIKADEDELKKLAKDASLFVPRVFMTAARVELAIQLKAFAYKDEELDDPDKEDLQDKYEYFHKQICRRKRANYELSRYCDVSNYRKKEIQILFEKALETDDEVKATQLQCGIVSLESAIKDYIERYAYPIKVRDLLETFDDILEDVNSFTIANLSELKQTMEEVEAKKCKKTEVREKKKSIQTKLNLLIKAQGQIYYQLSELDKIKFDSVALKRITSNFQADIEEDPEIYFIRHNSKVDTGQKSWSQVQDEISERIRRINAVFDTALAKINKTLKLIKRNHENQISNIYNCLKMILVDLERNGFYDYANYKFTDSVAWKMNFANIDFQKFEKEVWHEVVGKSTCEIVVNNDKKKEWWNSGNPFKWFGSLFMDDTISQIKKVDGYYKVDIIRRRIDEYYQTLQSECDKMQKYFEEMTENSKAIVKNMTNQLLHEVEQFYHDIRTQNEQLDQLRGSIKDLNIEIAKREKTQAWLTKLENKIKGV